MRTWGIVVGFVAVLAGCDAGPVAVDGGAGAADALVIDWGEVCEGCRPTCGTSAGPCEWNPECAGCVARCAPFGSAGQCDAEGRFVYVSDQRFECPALCVRLPDAGR